MARYECGIKLSNIEQVLEIKTQLEFLKKAVSLSEAHPELQFIFCTKTEFLLEEYSWTAQQISDVYIDYVYMDTDGVIICINDIMERLDIFDKNQAIAKSRQMIIVETEPL